ncbi:MAG: four helix bundle protein [Patescibacteria group bacterium]|nr:four helix bundle protein [Patescibacteria group bacterium]
MYVKSYKDLIVWKKSIDLVEEIYKITKRLPKSETYGLSSQMQRAAIAIPSNIAEGSKRTTKEYSQFLSIAYGSAAELETQLILIRRIYPNLDIKKAESLLEEILKMLSVMLQKMKSLTPNP